MKEVKELEQLQQLLLASIEDTHELIHGIEELQLTRGCVEPWIVEETEGFPYGRQSVVKTEEVECILIYWKPRRFSPIHDHGASLGIVHVIDGYVTNEDFVLNEDGTVKKTAIRTGTSGKTILSETPNGKPLTL